mgnify:CR=1 FL=1
MGTEESNPYDIGIFRFPNARHLSNEQKYDFILKCWKPEPSYNFPKTVEGKNSIIRDRSDTNGYEHVPGCAIVACMMVHFACPAFCLEMIQRLKG